MIDNKKIGEIIKKHRKDTGISQANLAKDLSISRISYRRYEKGDSQFPLDVFLHAIIILKIPTKEIFNDQVIISTKKEKKNIFYSKYFWIFLSSFVLFLLDICLFIYAYLNPLYYYQTLTFLWRFIKFDEPKLIFFNIFLYLFLIGFLATLSIGIGGLIYEYIKKKQK